MSDKLIIKVKQPPVDEGSKVVRIPLKQSNQIDTLANETGLSRYELTEKLLEFALLRVEVLE